MKKIISVVVALLMLFSMFSISAFAADTPVTADVYVTIAKAGKLVVTQEKITVTDKNYDGKLDIDETLFATHEAKYDGKAAAGYESYTHAQYGLSLKKLWGDTSGSFGYYVNNASAWSLADEVKDGDYVNAFVYKQADYSDKYCYFDKNTATATHDGEIAVTLSTIEYPAPDYLPTAVPVKDATITLNGVATTVKTDTEGKATVKLPDAGKVVISATSDTQTLVPPVCIATVASTESVNAYVTIAKAGTLVVTQEKITVTDADKDGYLTINDALYNAHEAKYEGKAAAGYGSAYTQYGLSLTKLWGDTSGSFGYYVNNKSAWSLADTVKEGDYITAFVYKDATAWSDKYSFFDKNTLTATADEEITLTLSAAGYDQDYNPITIPVKDATITINGEAAEYKTDANGKVTIKITTAGSYVISATSTTDTLVPPVVIATVNAKTPVYNTPSETPTTPDEEIKSPQTGDNSNILFYVILLSISAMGIVVCSAKLKRKADEK